MYYNSYESLCNDQGRWFKSNFHVHEGESVLSTLTAYKKAGFDIVTVSGQRELFDTQKLGESVGIRTFNGEEYIEKDGILLIGVNAFFTGTPQQAIDACNKSGGFTVACHPHLAPWIDSPESPLLKKDEILTLNGLTGVEIMTGALTRNQSAGRGLGLSCASDFWDEMLSAGTVIWGFGNDDFHEMHDINVAWTDIYADSDSWDDIHKSVREGCLCTSTGLRLFKFELDDTTLTVNANYPFCVDNRIEYRFIGRGGRLLSMQNNCIDGVFEIDIDEPYIRVEAVGPDGAKLWTQPILNKNIYGSSLPAVR